MKPQRVRLIISFTSFTLLSLLASACFKTDYAEDNTRKKAVTTAMLPKKLKTGFFLALAQLLSEGHGLE